jgi:hypothetical protein
MPENKTFSLRHVRVFLKKRELIFEGMSTEVIENKCSKNIRFPASAEVVENKRFINFLKVCI